MASQSRYLSASEAAAALGVARATLYAYTSRGYLPSEAVPGRPRESRYDRIEELAREYLAVIAKARGEMKAA